MDTRGQATEQQATVKATIRDLPHLAATSTGIPSSDSIGALAALRRAALKAQRQAIETDGFFAVWRDGKMVYATEVLTTEEDIRALAEAEKKAWAQQAALQQQASAKEIVLHSD